MEQIDLATLTKMRAQNTAIGLPEHFCLLGFDDLELLQVPPTTGDQLVMWYDRWRTATNNLTTGNQLPVLIPTPFHDVLEMGASLKIAGRYESLGQNQTLGELRAWVKNHQGVTPRRLKVGYQRYWKMRPSVPSQDIFSTRW
jgi:hypothetical protein